MASIRFWSRIEGQDVADACSGDKLEALEIVRVGEEAKVECNRSFVGLKGARLKQQAALKAESEKMETLAGFEKTESGLRYQFIQEGW
jgi:peptidyl-prolyl cis-trans isomerase A (cyclophilin A)